MILDRTVIRIDGGTQPRVAISEAVMREYADKMLEGVVLPPVDVFHDGATYWLADGFHRYHAAGKIGRSHLTVTLHTGTRRDAVLFAVAANQGHGLQRTTADKRKAVTTLLADEEWGKWSHSEISRRCGVAHTFVGDVNRGYRVRPSGSLVQSTSEPRRYRTKHGTEATMNVENIGRRRPPQAAPVTHKGTARTRGEREDRIALLTRLAADGHSTGQIAALTGVGVEGLRQRMRDLKIDVPGDRTAGHRRRPNANRIVDQMVMDAEHLTADVNLIDFTQVDRARLQTWTESLVESQKALGRFIARLLKMKRETHDEALQPSAVEDPTRSDRADSHPARARHAAGIS